MALAYAEQGQLELATALVKEVTLFARTQGFIRLFVDLGPSMEKLLTQVSKTLSREKGLSAYLKTLLEAFSQVTPAQTQPAPNQKSVSTVVLTTPLTRQEEKVLRLLAAGQTNPQIARELVVSVNTVRTQVQSIFRKLEVDNRQAASAIARQLHLI
jgi:LuxR family maltose regulon positive regulatory protein